MHFLCVCLRVHACIHAHTRAYFDIKSQDLSMETAAFWTWELHCYISMRAKLMYIDKPPPPSPFYAILNSSSPPKPTSLPSTF